jgi:hypothetical protein
MLMIAAVGGAVLAAACYTACYKGTCCCVTTNNSRTCYSAPTVKEQRDCTGSVEPCGGVSIGFGGSDPGH